ncbi:hypothetical protein HY484_01075 [Candidatus Woesearchaeota archaeon]|nr:hypothetical protein [Candidatus Woesearchaeota archaeon]
MVKKNNTNQVVWKLLQMDLAIQKDIHRQIINTRALAKYLIKKYGLSQSGLDAVISAIRRFENEAQFEEEEKILHHVFKESVISTRNNIACLTLSLTVNELVKRWANAGKLPPARVTTGRRTIKVMVDQPDINLFKAMFASDEIIKIEENLSEICVVVSERGISTKGVMARIANELALANINVHELIVCPPEFLIYVRQSDIVRAHESILKLSQGQ